MGNPPDPASPLDETTARQMTTAVRTAVQDARRAVAELAHRVRSAHEARVWLVLGYASWADYAVAEFGVGRAQAYRLINISRAVGAIEDAVRAAVAASPAGDAATTLELGLSGRALRDIHPRLAEVVAQVSERLTAAAAHGGAVPPEQAAEIVRQVVEDARQPPRPDPVPPVDPEPETEPETAVSPVVAQARKMVADLRQGQREIGLIALELAPAYLSEERAADVLRVLGDDLGEDVVELLACRRFAATGDQRALDVEADLHADG